MSFVFLFFIGFVLGITGAMIPGPLTLFTVSETLKTDRRAGFKAVFGHIMIEFILVAGIIYGFHWFIASKEFLFAVSVIGGAALMAMGAVLFLNAKKMRLSAVKTNAGPGKGLILGGMLFSIASPGFLVWWTTIGLSSVIKASLLGLAGVSVLILGHWLADVLWYGSLSYAVERGRKHLSDSSYQHIIRVFSFLLLALGLQFIVLQ